MVHPLDKPVRCRQTFVAAFARTWSYPSETTRNRYMAPDRVEENIREFRGGWFSGIQTRLAVLFSLVFVIALVVMEFVDFLGVPFTAYNGRFGDARIEAIKGLDLIADLKEERLLRWIEERRDDIHVLARNRSIAAQFEALRSAVGQLSAEHPQPDDVWFALLEQPSYTTLAEHLDLVKKAYGVYERILIVDAATGRILVSTEEVDVGTDVSDQSFFRETLRSPEDYVGDVQASADPHGPVFHVGHGVFRTEGEVVALIIGEVSTEGMIRPMLHTGEGLGARGESLLVNKDVKILTSLKHPLLDGTRPEPLAYQITAEPAVRAARGERDVIESDDYRNEPVLAAFRYIEITPELGWGMVVKRDRAELLAPLRHDILDSFWVGLASVLLVVMLTIGVARTVTRPLRSLSQTTRRVAAGNLSARAEVATSDEVGMLASTFNTMIERIQHWQEDLETEVGARTAELLAANEELNREVGQRKQAEAELARHLDQLEDLVAERTRDLEEAQEALIRQERLAALGQLTAVVSHELRNPLGTIRTSFYTIDRRLRGKMRDLEPALDRIERSILRCNAIIIDLLDFGRVRSLDLCDTEIDQWLEGAIDEFEIPENIVLSRELNCGASLPLDQERFLRCVLNVLSNACQAMPDGGMLRVSSNREDGGVAIRLADTGCGIPPEKLEKILEPLYSTKTFGVGLGLPIVKQIIEQHGGRISVQSRPGDGTTIVLHLPMQTSPTNTSKEPHHG